MAHIASDDRVAELALALDDLRAREQAVAAVLRALSGSRLKLQPMLDQIVEAAARLCRADSGFLYLREVDLYRMRASFGQPREVVDHEREHPDKAGPQSCTGRVAMTRQPVHIPDVDADPDYAHAAAGIGPYRTLLGLPVLFDGELLGVIGLARNEVRPFEEGQIALMATFADQSAIAIANSKLFETVERPSWPDSSHRRWRH
jgi:two-component system, NtrC family, sensor kinase